MIKTSLRSIFVEPVRGRDLLYSMPPVLAMLITSVVLRSKWGDGAWLGIVCASGVVGWIVQMIFARTLGPVLAKRFPTVQVEPWTDRCRNLFEHANKEAYRLNHEYIGPEHLLLALSDDNAEGIYKPNSGVAAVALKHLNVDLTKLRADVEKLVKSDGSPKPVVAKLPLTPRARRIVEWAMEESRKLKHDYSGTEHILLAMLRDDKGLPSFALSKQNVTYENARQSVIDVLAAGKSAVA